MEDLVQFDSLQDFLVPVSDDMPCGNDLDEQGHDAYMRIERDIDKAEESREWKELLKECRELLLHTKDFRLLARFNRILIQTNDSPIEGLVQGLYVAYKYADDYWIDVYPPEDKEDPEEKYADRINAIAELGAWATVVLPLRKKCGLLNFNGMEAYFLDDLVAFKNGEVVENKQPLNDVFGALSEDEKARVDNVLSAFVSALDIAENLKKMLSDKSGVVFTDFDEYLLPALQEGVSVLSEIVPNSGSEIVVNEEAVNTSSNSTDNSVGLKASGTVQSRDDVVKLIDMICAYYKENEPSSPLPLLLMRARSIVHKDFLGVLEELVPDSISMTEPVFGRQEDTDDEY